MAKEDSRHAHNEGLLLLEPNSADGPIRVCDHTSRYRLPHVNGLGAGVPTNEESSMNIERLHGPR